QKKSENHALDRLRGPLDHLSLDTIIATLRPPPKPARREMPTIETLAAGTPWVNLHSTATDWDRTEAATLRTMLARLHLIRAFEEQVLALAGDTLVHGPAHSSIGQEGGAVGAMLPLRASDHVNGSHRGHHQFLAKALGFLARNASIDITTPVEGE